MIIKASKKEDILKRRAEWQSQYDAQKAQHDKEDSAWTEENYKREQSIRDAVSSELSEFTLLDFDIYVSAASFGEGGYEVRINSDESRKFDDDVALSWNYNVYVTDDGEVKSKTGSWSGLSAVTESQLASLQQTVECLRKLNSLDWKTILSVKRPRYSEYVKTRHPEDLSSEFDRELLEAEISDLVGKPILVKGKTEPGRWGRPVWIGVVRETPKQLEIFQMGALDPAYVNQKSLKVAKMGTYKISKDKFFRDMLVTPIETLNESDIPEAQEG